MADEPSVFESKPEDVKRLFQYVFAPPAAEDHAVQATSVDTIAERPGGRIDRYLLQSTLGEGGMGIVFLAEQEEPVSRQVALKVIKPGMDSRNVISRFKAEQQTLAVMEHPHIAKIYDAGLTLSGRPYFVMEYVQGLPITDYCDRHRLTIEQRLRLFQRVCDAVQHAHQKGIIHRDIKPSNILVSVENDRAVPKIIDFGVAKAMGRQLTDQTVSTVDSQLLGTPEYMSPEQADMATEDIDTRSDVYSLGVLLYVLLTGGLPFDSKALRDSGIEHLRRTIRETDPKTPSTRLAKLGDEARKVAENRRIQVATLAKRLRSELEWIPLKAMRKERSERYRSASELADDIENYLRGAPLIAGPLSTKYRLKKFVQRNCVLVGGIVAVLVVLSAGVLVSTTLAIKAERARSRAQAVSDYLLENVLDSGRDGALLERDFGNTLDNAVKGLEGRFKDQPLVEADIRYSLGHKYLEEFEPETAMPLLERAYQIRRKHLGSEHGDTLHTAMMLGWAHSGSGRFDDAIRLWTEQIEMIRGAHGDGDWRIMQLMTCIGDLYKTSGNYEEAEAYLEEALERWEPLRDRPVFRFRLFAILKGRGENYLAQGRYAEAEQTLRKALELDVRSGVQRLSCMRTLSAVYRALGLYEKAQRLCETTLDTMRKDLGEDHWATLKAKRELGCILMDQGRLPEAEKLISEALQSGRLKRGNAHENTLRFINALAVVYTKQSDYADANDLFVEALKGTEHVLGDNHPVTLKTLNDFAVLRRAQRNYPEAEKLLRQALDGRKLKLGQDHPGCFESMYELAVLYKEQAEYEKAEPLLVEAVEGRSLKLGDTHPHTQESIKTLIALYEAWNKPELAEEWRARLAQKEDSKE